MTLRAANVQIHQPIAEEIVRMMDSQLFDTVNNKLIRPDGSTFTLNSAFISRINTPRLFDWTTFPFQIGRNIDGTIAQDLDFSQFIPTPTKQYYVDPVNGSDAAAGTTGAPLLSLSVALAKSDVDQIIIQGLTANFIARTTKGWSNTQPTRSVSVLNPTGFRFISAVVASAAVPTWTVNGTYSNVYQATFSATNSQAVTDVSTSTVPTYVDPVTGATIQVTWVPKRFKSLTLVASIAAVAATPYTWFNDGTNTYVNASRNIIGDGNILVTANTNNGRFPATNSLTVYVDGIDFVGGRPFYCTVAEAAAITGTILVHKNCSFQGGGVSNGLSIEFNQLVYGYRSLAADNRNDGFNYHCPTAPTAAGLNISPKFVEIECCSIGNGAIGYTSSSDNATTCHEYSRGIRINGAYINSDDRPIVDIDNTITWTLGGFGGQAFQTSAGNQDVVALNNAIMYLDSVKLQTGANALVNADNAAKILTFNMGTLANVVGSTGTVSTYVP